MKKFFAGLFAVLAVNVYAQYVQVGDIVPFGDFNLEILSLSPAQMAIAESPDATGDIEIPDVVTHYDVDYTITTINPMAFLQNTNITSVVFPSTLVEIGWQAFMGCTEIETLHFPASLEKIGNSAFYCFYDEPSALQSIKLDGAMPPTCGEMVFGSTSYPSGVSQDVVVIVPEGKVDLYRSTKGWNYFFVITDDENWQSIDEIEDGQKLNPAQPMYDMQGQSVDASYQGVVVQDGRKYLLH